MSFVMGTMCYGQDNGYRRFGNCEKCGFHGPLKTYDTCEIGYLYLVPILPIGRKRVFDECCHCKHSREIPLGRYKRARASELPAALEVLKADHQDPALVAQSIRQLMNYACFEEFKAAAPLLEERYAREAGVLVELGAAYTFLGDLSSAETVLDRILFFADSFDFVKELFQQTLIRNLTRQKKFDDALELLSSVSLQNPELRTTFFFFIEGLLNEGRQADALAILNDFAEVEDLYSDELYSSYIEKIKSEALSEDYSSDYFGEEKSLESLPRTVPLWTPVAIDLLIGLLLLSVYVLYSLDLEERRRVWVVNGTQQSYQVEINGKDYVLRGQEKLRLYFPEGELQYRVKAHHFNSLSQSVHFSSSLFARPVDRRTFILNPDGLALLSLETGFYAAKGKAAQEGKRSWQIGKHFYQIEGIDFLFSPFPAEISMSSDDREVERRSLRLVAPRSFEERLAIVTVALKEGEEERYWKDHVLLETKDKEALQHLYSLFLPDRIEEFVRFLERGLKSRPVLVEWHELYQQVCQKHMPQIEIEQQYRDDLRQEPKNAPLKYLLGLLLKDREAAETLFRESEKGRKPIGYGWSALGHRRQCSGHFEEALTLNKKARAILIEHARVRSQLRASLLALKRYEELLTVLEAERSLAPNDLALMKSKLHILTVSGQRGRASKERTRFMQSVRHLLRKQVDLEEIAAELDAAIAYSLGDAETYCQLMEQSRRRNPCQIHILRGRLEDALIVLKNSNDNDFRNFLVFYCAAKKVKSFDKEAEQALQRAVELMQLGNLEMKMAGAMLGGDEALVKSNLESLSLPSEYKSLIALSLSFRFPKSADLCRRIAKKHNYQFEFPRLIVRQLLRIRD